MFLVILNAPNLVFIEEDTILYIIATSLKLTSLERGSISFQDNSNHFLFSHSKQQTASFIAVV